MKTLSTAKLAQTVLTRRNELGLTQEQLGDKTSMHRIMIGRLEREDFIPSIVQLQALSIVLDFDITEMFIDKEETQTFVALRGKNLTDEEKEGVDTIISMMLALRQQMVLRSTYEC